MRIVAQQLRLPPGSYVICDPGGMLYQEAEFQAWSNPDFMMEGTAPVFRHVDSRGLALIIESWYGGGMHRDSVSGHQFETECDIALANVNFFERVPEDAIQFTTNQPVDFTLWTGGDFTVKSGSCHFEITGEELE